MKIKMGEEGYILFNGSFTLEDVVREFFEEVGGDFSGVKVSSWHMNGKYTYIIDFIFGGERIHHVVFKDFYFPVKTKDEAIKFTEAMRKAVKELINVVDKLRFEEFEI